MKSTTAYFFNDTFCSTEDGPNQRKILGHTITPTARILQRFLHLTI